ncbi:hypothetical protein FKM82_002220 [Ascaphus truei]|uniref:peroxiredoxin-6-like isoform X1 n=1 Tax=Ascaphus truei TaxID=8439 RepID=UPI003F5A90DB
MPHLLIDDKFPDFTADSTNGKMSCHEYFGKSWGILFSHPGDFTPVCTTELAHMVKLMKEFNDRNLKVIGMSLDTTENHHLWSKDINTFNCDGSATTLPFPIFADPTRDIAVLLGMVDPSKKTQPGLPLTARHLFVVSPEKKLRLVLVYPASTGRNFSEILRAVDSLQITEKYGVSTEADWKPCDRVVVPETFPPDKAAALFPGGVKVETFPSGKKYLQFACLKDCK